MHIVALAVIFRNRSRFAFIGTVPPEKSLVGQGEGVLRQGAGAQFHFGCTEHPWWRGLHSLQGALILPNPQKRFVGLRAVQVVLGYL
jgi:hypothetical protein